MPLTTWSVRRASLMPRATLHRLDEWFEAEVPFHIGSKHMNA